MSAQSDCELLQEKQNRCILYNNYYYSKSVLMECFTQLFDVSKPLVLRCINNLYQQWVQLDAIM